MSGFWTGGYEAMEKELRLTYQAKRKQLRERLNGSDGDEQQKLRAEIKRLDDEYKANLQSLIRSNF